MTHDYSAFYSTVAVLVPVFLFLLYWPEPSFRMGVFRVGANLTSLLRAILHLLGASVALLAGTGAEIGSLYSLYEPARTTRVDRAIIFYALLLLVCIVLTELAERLSRRALESDSEA